MELCLLSPEDWAMFSEKAHLICFNERRTPEMDRIDYCLVTKNEDIPLTYSTVREVDQYTFYMQYGGAFPSCAKSVNVVRSFQMMMNFLRERYLRGTMLVENTNSPMLKLAMSQGWLIKGLRVFNGAILLEHQIEFNGGV